LSDVARNLIHFIMKAILFSIKPSASGKHDVVSIQVSISKATALGLVVSKKFFNLLLEKDTCKLAEGEEFDLDLSAFDTEISTLTYQDGTEHQCTWLVPIE
jgi:hypothetical protein